MDVSVTSGPESAFAQACAIRKKYMSGSSRTGREIILRLAGK
jgi:hypothetical protein